MSRTKKQINSLFDDKSDTLYYLKDRWEDEKEYEDFEDYIDVIKKIFADYHFKDIRVNKRFNIKCKSLENDDVEISITKKGIKVWS